MDEFFLDIIYFPSQVRRWQERKQSSSFGPELKGRLKPGTNSWTLQELANILWYQNIYMKYEELPIDYKGYWFYHSHYYCYIIALNGSLFWSNVLKFSKMLVNVLCFIGSIIKRIFFSSRIWYAYIECMWLTLKACIIHFYHVR